MSRTEILNAARQLSREERIELAQEIWETVSEEATPELDDELRAELERRIAAADAEPGNFLTLEEFERRVRS